MSGHSPVVSGAQLVTALERVGWRQVHRRGSHLRLKHPDRVIAIVVPLHKELKRGTPNGVLRDVGLSAEDLRKLL